MGLLAHIAQRLDMDIAPEKITENWRELLQRKLEKLQDVDPGAAALVDRRPL